MQARPQLTSWFRGINGLTNSRIEGLTGRKRVNSVLIGVILSVAALSGRQGTQTFTGVITDDVCAKEGHRGMQMGPTDAECTRLCVMVHDASYVLADSKDVYALSDQRTPYEFAGQKVKVVGTLDVKTNTIHVDSMTAAE